MTWKADRYRSSHSTEWGQLFGLPVRSLTDEQLDQIEFSKLLEFVSHDDRVEKLIGDRLAKATPKEIARLSKLFLPELEAKGYIVSQYNKIIFEREAELEKSVDQKPGYYNSTSRGDYVFWELLNESNKHNEYKRYADGKDSVINDSNIDYQWLYNKYPELAVSLADTVSKKMRGGYYGAYNSGAGRHMIANIPSEMIDNIMPQIFEKDKYVFCYALSNPHLPDEYTIKALRGIVKRSRSIPRIRVPITKAILNKIPTVKRLEVLESMLYESESPGNINFVDLKTEEDLKGILFGAVMRHTGRVERVVKKFKQLFRL